MKLMNRSVRLYLGHFFELIKQSRDFAISFIFRGLGQTIPERNGFLTKKQDLIDFNKFFERTLCLEGKDRYVEEKHLFFLQELQYPKGPQFVDCKISRLLWPRLDFSKTEWFLNQWRDLIDFNNFFERTLRLEVKEEYVEEKHLLFLQYSILKDHRLLGIFCVTVFVCRVAKSDIFSMVLAIWPLQLIVSSLVLTARRITLYLCFFFFTLNKYSLFQCPLSLFLVSSSRKTFFAFRFSSLCCVVAPLLKLYDK